MEEERHGIQATFTRSTRVYIKRFSRPCIPIRSSVLYRCFRPSRTFGLVDDTSPSRLFGRRLSLRFQTMSLAAKTERMVKPKKTCPVLLVMSVAMVIAGCDRGSSQNDMNTAEAPALMPERVVKHAPMPSTPPIPLEQLESKIEKRCSIDLDQWRRTYAYTWLHEPKRFSNGELSFSFDKGPYPDLRPSRSWRDLIEVIEIDDRPGIEVIFGHYNLKTHALKFEMGPCRGELR